MVLAIGVDRRDEADLPRRGGEPGADAEYILLDVVAEGGIEVVEVELEVPVAAVGVAAPVLGLQADVLGEVALAEQRVDMFWRSLFWRNPSVW